MLIGILFSIIFERQRKFYKSVCFTQVNSKEDSSHIEESGRRKKSKKVIVVGSKPVRSIVVGLMSLVALLTVLSIVVMGTSILIGDIIRPGSPAVKDLGNISGSAFNLSISIAANNSHGDNIANVSFMFYYRKNSSIMRNITLQNQTRNQTQWNTTLDTTSFPEGMYNITVMVWNYSTEAGVNQIIINDSFYTNVTIDNTPPMLNFSTGMPGVNSSVLDGGKNFTVSSGPLTLILFADDKRPGSNVNLTLTELIVSISNGSTGTRFNRTAVNNSGNWTIIINVSDMKPGLTTVFAYVNDTAGNRNTTKPFNFTVNTPPNVTIWTNQSINLSDDGPHQRLTINFSVGNVSQSTGLGAANMSKINITLEFDNATGTDFNITLGISPNFGFNYSLANYSLDPTQAVFNHSTKLSGARDFIFYHINDSQLAEGTHTVKIHVYDGAGGDANLGTNNKTGNVNNSQVLNFRVDNTFPTATVSCTSSPTVGAIVTCTCSGSDSGTGTKSVAFLGGVATSESTTATNAGATSESSLCVVTDHAGHRTEKRGSWVTQAASNGGGGGGGGASGGSSSGGGTGTSATYEKKVWTSINAGEVATVTPRNTEFSVESVEFKVTDTVYGAWAKVEPVTKSELPAEANAQLTGKVHDTIEITINKVALTDAKVADRTVKFKVPKTWLTENSVDKNSVVLMRFDESTKKWQELATTAGEDDGTNIKYTAQTPGFSFFAIAEKGAASGATTVAPTTPTGASASDIVDSMEKPKTTTTSSKPVSTTSGGSSALWWIVAAVVVVAAVVYFVRRRKA